MSTDKSEAQTEWMPPLPPPERRSQGLYMPETEAYTADQMRRAQADAARAALEQAIEVCQCTEPEEAIRDLLTTLEK